jgi:hypothetical protein
VSVDVGQRQEVNSTSEGHHAEEGIPMIDNGGYGERMAGYLHLNEATACDAGLRQVRISCDQTSLPQRLLRFDQPIPSQNAFSITPASSREPRRPSVAGRQIGPAGKRPSGGVTILDLQQEPVAFFPNPIDVVQLLRHPYLCSRPRSTSPAQHSMSSGTKIVPPSSIRSAGRIARWTNRSSIWE